MKRILFILMLMPVFIFAESESFYKNKYDYYMTKKQTAYENWQRQEAIVSISESMNSQIRDSDSQIRSLNRLSRSLNSKIENIALDGEERGLDEEERATEVKASEEKKEAQRLKEIYIDAEDKLMELQFTVEEKLGKLPEWFIKIVARK